MLAARVRIPSSANIRKTSFLFWKAAYRPWNSRPNGLLFGRTCLLAAAPRFLLASSPWLPSSVFLSPSARGQPPLLISFPKIPSVIEQSSPDEASLVYRIPRKIYFSLACFFRSLYLGVIFLPSILLWPAYYLSRSLTVRRLYHRLLLRSLEFCGPTFIKLGQWISTRPDVFPTDLSEILAKLHDNVPPHSFRQTTAIVTKALQQISGASATLDDTFSYIDPNPIGSGCIAQVYRAQLRSATDLDQPLWVAVKVRHPNILFVIEMDLAIMHFVAECINCLPTMEWLSLPEEVEQFAQLMQKQLDLRVEAKNLKRFRENFRESPKILFPKPMYPLVTEEMLVEEYFEGVPVRHFMNRKASRGNNSYVDRSIADLGLVAFLQMTLKDNFIHSDLHPGNIMVQMYNNDRKRVFPVREILVDGKLNEDTLNTLVNEGYHPRIILLDTGLTTELTEANLINFLDLFQAVAEGDGLTVAKLMVERARGPNRCLDYFGFESKMAVVVKRVQLNTFRLAKVQIGEVLGNVLSLVRQHHVKIESDFTNLVVSIMILEGLGRQLNPEIDLFESARPFLKYRKREFYTRHGGLAIKFAAFLEARSWLLRLHDMEKDAIVDVLGFNNF